MPLWSSGRGYDFTLSSTSHGTCGHKGVDALRLAFKKNLSGGPRL
jgi:hypothetical protein